MTYVTLLYQRAETEEELRSCAVFQRKLFEAMVTEYGMMWDDILFPCADARSVVVAQSLSEPSVFGTHALINSQDISEIRSIADKVTKETGCTVQPHVKLIPLEPESIKKAFRVTPKERKGAEGRLVCGDFAQMILSVGDTWKIRDAARKFLSYVETVSDKSGKSIIGLIGGIAVFDTDESKASLASNIYAQKTGFPAKAKIYTSPKRRATE